MHLAIIFKQLSNGGLGPCSRAQQEQLSKVWPLGHLSQHLNHYMLRSHHCQCYTYFNIIQQTLDYGFYNSVGVESPICLNDNSAPFSLNQIFTVLIKFNSNRIWEFVYEICLHDLSISPLYLHKEWFHLYISTSKLPYCAAAEILTSSQAFSTIISYWFC